MLDIRLFREKPEAVRAGFARMGTPIEQVDEIRALDDRLRALKTEAETKKAEMNAASKAMGKASPEERELKRAELRALGDSISESDAQRDAVEKELSDRLLRVPNLPDDRVPEGESDADNVCVRAWGEPKTFDFTPKPHWEIGEKLGIHLPSFTRQPASARRRRAPAGPGRIRI